jgi:hypothetical protein
MSLGVKCGCSRLSFCFCRVTLRLVPMCAHLRKWSGPSRFRHDSAARASVVVHTRAIPGIFMRSRYAARYLVRKSHIILRKSSASCGSISTDAIRLQIWLILGIASQLFRRPRGGPLAKISADGRKFLLGGAKYLSGQACRAPISRCVPRRIAQSFSNKSLAWIHKLGRAQRCNNHRPSCFRSPMNDVKALYLSHRAIKHYQILGAARKSVMNC